MSATIAAPAEPEDDDVLDRVPCRCGAFAAVVLDHVDGDVWVAARCACGMFLPAEAAEGSRS